MSTPAAPRAPRRPQVLTMHGDERVDDWYWLRERDDPEVRAYLQAENDYADAVLAPTASLRDRIFDEIRSRIQETDVTAPVPDRMWEYYARTIEEKQYAIHCRRRRLDEGSPEEAVVEHVLLDENVLAGASDYFALGGFETSPDQCWLAYSTDHTGGERYTLRFRDLETGEDAPDVIQNVTYGLAWADDCTTIFYVRPDEAMRPHEVWRHHLGRPVTDDVLVFREDDERFFVDIGRTRSGRFILIDSASKMTTEVRFVPTDDADAQPRVVAPREQGHEYSVEHHWNEERGDRFLIVTNASGGAPNFKLVAAPAVDPERQYWADVVPHRDDVRLDGVSAFLEHIVLSERANGLEQLRVMRMEDGEIRDIAFPDPVYTAGVGPNAEYETPTLRYRYTSLVAPVTDIDYDMETRAEEIVRRQPVLGGYDLNDYTSARLWATAPDGAQIPISVVHRRDVALDGTAPAVLYGYGSYEASMDPTFSASRLSLLDRGFVFAIAHVRGGGELGRAWYEQGRLEHKANTFTDFIGCAEHLVAQHYTSPQRLVARGGSAGGLLMGVVANLRPELFSAIVAEVPFVDVVTTMLDPSIPLTVTEWEEWGDPRDADTYAYLKSYSPYDNVIDQAYPSLYVTTGLNDPRVQYWEPAKWVAKLRTHSTSNRPIVLRTEMGAGHGGPSGRYDAWKDEAQILAFICHAVNVEP